MSDFSRSAWQAHRSRNTHFAAAKDASIGKRDQLPEPQTLKQGSNKRKNPSSLIEEDGFS
jgi:hypothetical protein